MSRMLTGCRSLLRCGCARAADDARDLAALDDESRFRRSDRDLIFHRTRGRAFARGHFLDVHHLAYDPTEGHDLVAALDRPQRLLLLLLLCRLRADEQEVEDREDEDDLDQEGRHRSEAAGYLQGEESGENS